MLERIIQNWTVFRLLIPIIIGLFVATFAFGMPDLYILGKHGVPAEGVITSFDPIENETTYTFFFAGSDYNDRFLYHKGSRPGYPKIGDKLEVTVDPENPARHRLGDVNAQFSDSLTGTLFIIVALFLVQLFRLLPNLFSRFNRQAKEEWEKHRHDPWIK